MLELLGSGASYDEVLRDYPFLEREDILAAIDYAAPDRSRRYSGFVFLDPASSPFISVLRDGPPTADLC